MSCLNVPRIKLYRGYLISSGMLYFKVTEATKVVKLQNPLISKTTMHEAKIFGRLRCVVPLQLHRFKS